MKPTVPCRDEQSCRAALDSVGVFNLVTDERFFDTVEAHLPVHRERLYTPTQTLAMFVSQILSDDRSCQRVVDEHIARCAAHGMRVPSSSTGAYSDARQRLPVSLVAALADEVARAAMRTGVSDEHAPPTLLIDGTGFSMPDSAENQARYPQSSSQIEGCGFPEGRLVAMVCATTGAIVRSVVSPAKGKGTGETTALRALSERAAPGTIIVGDSIYENFLTWAALASVGCFGVFELNASRALERGTPRRLRIDRPRRPPGMAIETYRALPKRIKLRVVISTHATCRDKFLVTSLVDEARYPDEAVLAEYAKRWDVDIYRCGHLRRIDSVGGSPDCLP